MSPELFKYLVMFIYIGLTFYLSYVGMKKTKSLSGFSIGNKDMSPYLVGITMAASISSTATFVINPGFVYVHGMSAFVHYGIAALSGIIVALTVLSKGLRKLGAQHGSLTIPDWIRHRYGNKLLALFFAFINLLSITFIVLILVGCSIIINSLFGISIHLALVLTLLFVFSYVIMGGTYAHAYTNSMQGVMMIFISLFIFISGWVLMEGDFPAMLSGISANYAAFINPESNLYNSFFAVFVSGFLITSALMFQPHILTKVLYIKEDRDINKFLLTTFVCVGIFSLMLFVGFYAKFSGVSAAQDKVTMTYLIQQFNTLSWWGPYVVVLISITLLAAGMSTLDGILVSISAIVVNDIYYQLRSPNAKVAADNGLKLSRYVLIVIGLISFALAWNPPKLVGIFAQAGVYGIAAASFVPIIFGVVWKKHIPVWIMTTAAFIGLFGHLYLFKIYGVKNPSVSSCIAMLTSLVFATISLILVDLKSKEDVAV
ncbi:MAG: sodium:solute symporter family protein [Bacteriovoracaceae bacterium]|nr:sodium:solute symporter family protein [Bacteriovoracaceae bacterium]